MRFPTSQTWLALVAFFVTTSIHAAPPLGCVENSKGQRWCEGSSKHFQREAPQRDSEPFEPWLHPATKKAVLALFQPVGRVVEPLPIDQFLPGYTIPNPNKSEPWVGILPAHLPTSLTATEKK